MKSPWLSIIMPVHDSGPWLVEAFQSLVDQNDAGFECIVIDSSETDATQKLIDPFRERLDIIVHRRRDLDNWAIKTNFGNEIARADHVCSLHHDDFWRPGRMAKVRTWLGERPDAAMHFHPSVVVDARGRELGALRSPLQPGVAPTSLLLERLLVQNYISLPAVVWRRDCFAATGGLDLGLWYTGDWDLYFKLALAGPCIYHPEALTCYRIHGQSLTITGSRSSDDFRAQMQTVVDRYAGNIPAADRSRVLRAAQASIRVNISLAAASNGDRSALLPALASLTGLGLAGVGRYIRDSRIVERLVPRARARLAGLM